MGHEQSLKKVADYWHPAGLGWICHSQDENVIATLEGIAADVLSVTGFFHNGDYFELPEESHNTQGLGIMQNGVARTNCIDCLDRTNAAQVVIGKKALGHQLHALGIITEASIDYDTDAVNVFANM